MVLQPLQTPWERSPSHGSSPHRLGLCPALGACAGAAAAALFAHQEAEQTLVTELAALARVPLGDHKPSSSKLGQPGELCAWWAGR